MYASVVYHWDIVLCLCIYSLLLVKVLFTELMYDCFLNGSACTKNVYSITKKILNMYFESSVHGIGLISQELLHLQCVVVMTKRLSWFKENTCMCTV